MATVNSRYTLTLGPIKMELVDLSDVDTSDTFVTNLQDPRYMIALNQSGGPPNLNPASRTGLSGSRTIEFQQTQLSSDSILALVFGY